MPLIIPTPERKSVLQETHRLLRKHKDNEDVKSLGKACQLMLADQEFQPTVAANSALPKTYESPADLLKLAWAYLYFFLSKRDYVAAAMILWDEETFAPEPQCVQDVWDALRTQRMVGIIGGGGLGKCLGPDVLVQMFDGSTKAARDIKIGDILMGDDNEGRRVLESNPGFGPMYRIVPERGEPWTCNDEHILSLICGYDKLCGNGSVSAERYKGMKVDVPLKEWIAWSKSKKEYFFQYHVGAEFPAKGIPFDPYIYGAWIGDGGFDVPALHTPDGPMARAWVDYFSHYPGMMVTSGYHDKCPMWCARIIERGPGRSNPFTDFIRTSRAKGEKIIRSDYLENSRHNRLQLLAGLIDSDGWVQANHAYGFCTKSENLARQVLWLARSLGLCATLRSGIKGIKSIGFSATYWTVYISGNNIIEVPTKEKHATPNITNKNLSYTRFSAEPLGEGDYHGFVIDGNHRFLLGDFTVTHNTYSPSAYLLLEWILDPEWTRVQIASASEDHLKKNLYADIVRLHEGAVLPLPGVPDADGISLNKKTGMGIFTLVLPGGPLAKGKIKGAHTKPRPYHPIFKRRSRVFMIIDEAQEVPQNVFIEIPNRFSTATKGDVDHIKFIVCANPKDQFSQFGKALRPTGGYQSVPLTQRTWISEEGWFVVSINAMDHENVRQQRVVYGGFVTYEGVQNWIRRCHGDDQHPDMYTFVYGRFPPQGTLSTIIQRAHVTASERDWIFDSNTESAAGFDPAYTGDRPALTTARTGRAVAWIGYDGQRHELAQPRIALQIDAVGQIPRGDTQDMTDEVCGRLKQLNVRPERYGQDTTGNGIGTHDLIRRQWTKKVGTGNLPEDAAAPITGINYATSPTEIKIAEEDTETPKEMFDSIASELWYAAAKLFECDCIGIGRGVPLEAIEELVSRRGSSKAGKGRKRSVESKDSYKSRTGKSSPDFADSFLIAAHVARITTPGLIPKAKDTVTEPPQRGPLFKEPEIQETAANISGWGETLEVEAMRD